MSSWYSKMYRSHEAARERNRREQRRSDQDRHGPTFVAKYQLSVLNKEKRMMERELERIRKGIHKQPKHSRVDRMKGNDVKDGRKNDEQPVQEVPRKVDTGHSKDENALFDAMIFLQNNPSALVPIVSAHGQSDAYLETLEKVSPAFSAEEKQPFMPKYLKGKGPVNQVEKSAMLDKYKFLLQRHSPILRRNSPLVDNARNSPLLSRKHNHNGNVRDLETNSVDSGHHSRSTSNEKNGTSRHVMDQATSPLLSNEDIETLKHDTGDMASPTGRLTVETNNRLTPQPISSRSRRAPDLHELANGGMAGARDNINRRLSARDGDSVATDRRATSSGTDRSTDDIGQRATKATTLFPQDPEYYNPDGTLRTQYTMTSDDKRWEIAGQTRHVRTSKPREIDRELSLKEIFGNDKK